MGEVQRAIHGKCVFGFGVFLIESLEERIEAIHQNWLETRDYVNMPHPLAPIVRGVSD